MKDDTIFKALVLIMLGIVLGLNVGDAIQKNNKKEITDSPKYFLRGDACYVNEYKDSLGIIETKVSLEHGTVTTITERVYNATYSDSVKRNDSIVHGWLK